ncbi:type II secretion system F family protein [Aeromonas veronii]|uniref:Type II secretion system protein GspF domain-containing protein n=1 Tax=Aeromonas veronii TaxID=654 RepID=A0A4S5CDL1_AERVE|nr:type II secretion system F family protein [Aeromonas veronii]THJ43650.1 hypothetical protein E8Q35_15200 [Aeromonas veronii]
MIIDDFLMRYRVNRLKSKFNYAVRLDFYRNLHVLLKNNMKMDAIIKSFIEVYSGRRLGSNRPPLAQIMMDVSAKMNNGKSLSESLSDWIPYSEMMMIKAGEGASTLTASISDIIIVMKKQKAITSAIVKASVYPTILILGAAQVIVIIAEKVIPKLVKVSDIETWPLISMMLYHISNYVNEYGRMTMVGVILFCIFIAWTLPNWSRYLPILRVRAESIPPYSLYRIINGATFMINISVMLKAQIQLVEVLSDLKNNASPWLRDRLASIQYNIELGSNLGQALERSGYEFPDKRAVLFLKMLGSSSNSETAIYQYAMDWLDDAVEHVNKLAAILLGVGILFIGLVAVMILLGIQGMSDSIANM